MKLLTDLYSGSMALLTDMYQLTMSYGYWKSGNATKEAVFNLFFRENPFKGGYTIACGLEYVVDFIKNFHFTEKDLTYLKGMQGNDGKPLFEQGFLDFLASMKFECDVDALPEGTVVFPHEPIIRVRGPIYQCQLLETPLLNMINFQSLIATKASRISSAAGSDPVLEFGLRRAQGIDGALAASRAAYIGGCSSTSNVLAGKLFNIPVSGTHAHSWVMSFDNEKEAFQTYADAVSNNVVFLVDTYDTIEGLKTAIEVGRELEAQGKKLAGVRIDSGDLAYFGTQARRMLDEAGFKKTNVVASNDLDEYLIKSLKNQEAKINVWGVGTKLVTAFDQPALGAVYKLSAVRGENGEWSHRIKLSEQAIKVNNPGIQQVRRFIKDESFVADMIYDEPLSDQEEYLMIDPIDPTRRRRFDTNKLSYQDLLVKVYEGGACVYGSPSIQSIRERSQQQIKALHRSIRRFDNPHTYPVGLEKDLHDLKTNLILKLRKLQ